MAKPGRIWAACDDNAQLGEERHLHGQRKSQRLIRRGKPDRNTQGHHAVSLRFDILVLGMAPPQLPPRLPAPATSPQQINGRRPPSPFFSFIA